MPNLAWPSNVPGPFPAGNRPLPERSAFWKRIERDILNRLESDPGRSYSGAKLQQPDYKPGTDEWWMMNHPQMLSAREQRKAAEEQRMEGREYNETQKKWYTEDQRKYGEGQKEAERERKAREKEGAKQERNQRIAVAGLEKSVNTLRGLMEKADNKDKAWKDYGERAQSIHGKLQRFTIENPEFSEYFGEEIAWLDSLMNKDRTKWWKGDAAKRAVGTGLTFPFNAVEAGKKWFGGSEAHAMGAGGDPSTIPPETQELMTAGQLALKRAGILDQDPRAKLVLPVAMQGEYLDRLLANKEITQEQHDKIIRTATKKAKGNDPVKRHEEAEKVIQEVTGKPSGVPSAEELEMLGVTGLEGQPDRRQMIRGQIPGAGGPGIMNEPGGVPDPFRDDKTRKMGMGATALGQNQFPMDSGEAPGGDTRFGWARQGMLNTDSRPFYPMTTPQLNERAQSTQMYNERLRNPYTFGSGKRPKARYPY